MTLAPTPIPAAAMMTWAIGLAALPASQSPGTPLWPTSSTGTCRPMPDTCSCVCSPRDFTQETSTSKFSMTTKASSVRSVPSLSFNAPQRSRPAQHSCHLRLHDLNTQSLQLFPFPGGKDFVGVLEQGHLLEPLGEQGA